MVVKISIFETRIDLGRSSDSSATKRLGGEFSRIRGVGARKPDASYSRFFSLLAGNSGPRASIRTGSRPRIECDSRSGGKRIPQRRRYQHRG